MRCRRGCSRRAQVVALVNYLSQILVELVKFANLIVTITKSVACAGRIESVLATRAVHAHARLPHRRRPKRGNLRAL